MICPGCSEERAEKDFIKGKEKCFKCIYKEKTSKIDEVAHQNLCRICQKKCGEHRWVYCSRECSTIGELKMKKAYWTSKVKSL